MRKAALSLCWALLVWGCGGASAPASSSATQPPAREFFVSPAGDDFSPGTREAPFRTPDQARQAARAAKNSSGDVVITFRGGIHRLDHPLVLEPADSGQNGHPVVYRSEPGEHAVLSGSVLVSGFQSFDATRNLHRAFVGQRSSRQLYVNGQRAVRARTEFYPIGF
ncbi:MAG: hypothetical protein AB1758_37510, partial [Candidatus Eremiobacterota bacterium]